MNALTEILSHPFVHKLGWTLLHLLWQGAVVALLLAIVLRLLRKSSANLRYVVACSALAVVVILPVVTIRLVPAPPSYALLEAESASLLPPMAEAMKIVPVNLEAVEPFPAIGLKQRVVNLLEPTLPYIVAGWVLGVFTLSLWHLGGWAHLQRLKRRIVKVADAALIETLSALAAKLKVTRPVQLAESALVQIPAVVGWLRPVILLPAAAVTGLTAQQLEALLAHELAHIRRYDYLVNMLQTVVEILGFYHPAVWWLSHKIRDERENCCDDLAVNVCGDKMRYARALAEMERIRSTHGELALAANGGNLLMRIRRLIGNSSPPKQRFNWAAALVTAMVMAALAIPTTLALSRKYSSNAPPQPIVLATSETTDDLLALPGGSVVDEAQGLAQITFDCKIFELYTDLPALEPEPGEKTQDGLYVRTGNNYAQILETLAEQSKDIKVLASPTLRVLDGKQGIIKSESQMEYVKGYEEKPGNKSEPIKDTVRGLMELRIQGKVAADNQVRTQLSFFESTPSFEKQNDAQGREVQIPQIAKIECSTVVISPDRQPFIVGGLKSTGDPQHKIMLMITPTVTPAEDSAEAASAPDVNNIPPAPPVYVTDANENRLQTLFDFKIFQVPKNSKLIKDADNGNVFVRSDKAFADDLETLSKESKDARVLTAPRVITLEGEEAVISVGNDMPYTAGYTEQPGKGPKPIMRTVHGGYKIRVKAEVVDNTNVRTDFIFTQTDPTFTTHKVARGQEIQIPLVKTTECSAVVTSGDGGTLFIGGLQDAEKPNQTIIIQLTPHIIRAGQTAPVDDLPPNKGTKEEVSFTVAPQVVTSIRVDTLDAQALPSSRPEPVRVVEELIAMVKGQAPHSFELLNTQMAVAEQLKDLRTILAEQPVEIKPVLADDKEALAGGTSLIYEINTQGLNEEEKRGLSDKMITVLRRRVDPDNIYNLVWRPQGSSRFEIQMPVAEQLKDLRTILAEQPVEIESVLADDKEALVTTTTVKDDRNREGHLLFHLVRQHDKWIIDDIDFETPDTLKEELARFQTRSEASKSSRRRPADNNSQATGDRSIVIFKLQYADCGEASDMLHPLLVDMQGVTIVPDTNSNQLIINATEADLKRIADLIQKIDVAEIGRAQSGPSDIVVEIFPLEYADCEQAARLLNNLPTLDKAKIVADNRTNQLIVQASESEIEQISNLIRQLDQPIDEKTAEEHQAQKTEEQKGLEDQRKQLTDKLKDLQQRIRQLQREQGMAELTTRQDLMLQRVAGLMNELTKTESRRMQLETDLKLLEQDKNQPLPPQELLKMRQEYVNNDATVRALAEKAAQVEMELLLARQTSTNDSPEVKSKAALLEALKARLEQAKQEVAATFDDLMAKQAAETYRQKLIKAQTELEQNKSYEDRLRERLKDEDAETVRIAQIQQEIQLLRDESDSTREMYDEIGRRVMEFQTGLTSPARPGSLSVQPRNSTIEAPPPELKPIPPADQDK